MILDNQQSMQIPQIIQKIKINPAKSYKFEFLPDTIPHYNNQKSTLANVQYHYFTKPVQGYNQITLYNNGRPTKMFIENNYDQQQVYKNMKNKMKASDSSRVIDLSLRQFIQPRKEKQIVINNQTLVRDSTWAKKYQPQRFIDLLSQQKINRVTLTWLKSWDPIVFGNQNKLTQHKNNAEKKNVPYMFSGGKNKIGSNLNTFTNNQFKPNISAYDKSLNQLDYKKMILFAGPPGSGKTTLARVIGKHCKYAVHQINASDDRSAVALITKIQNMCNNDTLRIDKKPTMIIIDQVDGALQGQNNGLKAVLNYIQTGQKPKQMANNQKNKKQKKNDKNQKNNQQKQGEKLFLKRPVIFICNDPYAKGMKELRNKATVIYFSPAYQQKIVKRLKDICQKQKTYIQNDVIQKISLMCNNDIRSCVGLLQMICNMKNHESIEPKEYLNRIKISLKKDSQQSINQFVSDIITKKIAKKKTQANKHYNETKNDLFKQIQKQIYSIENKTLLLETFANNMHKNRTFKGNGHFRNILKLYEFLNYSDFVLAKDFQYHGQLINTLSLPMIYYISSFGNDQLDRVQFPRQFIQSINRIKNNKNTIDILFNKINDSLLSFKKKKTFPMVQLWHLYFAIQPNNLQQSEIVSCLSKMITYGIEFSGASVQKGKKYQNQKNQNNNNNYYNFQQSLIYKPQFELLFTYHNKRPTDIILSNSSKTLMEQSYEFVKNRMQILNHSEFGNNDLINGQMNKQNGQRRANGFETQMMIKKLTSNAKKRKRLPGMQKTIKYKYQQGSGTSIKSEIKLSFFL